MKSNAILKDAYKKHLFEVNLNLIIFYEKKNIIAGNDRSAW